MQASEERHPPGNNTTAAEQPPVCTIFATQLQTQYFRPYYGRTTERTDNRPSNCTLLGRLGRRNAIGRNYFLYHFGNSRQRHLHIPRLSCRHTRSARSAHRCFGLPGARRSRQSLHTRRQVRRAHRNEPRCTQDTTQVLQAHRSNHHRQ